jgi:hypothetical protein
MRFPLIVRLLSALLCGLALLWSLVLVGAGTFVGAAYLLYRSGLPVDCASAIGLGVSLLVSCTLVSRLRFDGE